MNRKDFIKAGSAIVALHNMPAFISKPGFELLILATNWGFGGDIFQFCEAAKKEGYDGIELWWPPETKDQEALATALQSTKLKAGFLCGGYQANVTEHFNTFKQAIDEATSYEKIKPLYINCHSGRDWFSEADNNKFILYTTERSKASGVPIYHETHRSRILFAAHVAHRYMEKHPALKLTLDISHWCNVHESLLADQSDTVKLALQRAEHIHARVGHPEGPQVNDPRAPEWEKIVQQHLHWWDEVVQRKKAKGERMTILTEFGPPDYMSTEPYTRKPLSDQWAVNVHMMHLLRKRYS